MTHHFEINRNGDSAKSIRREFTAVMEAANNLEEALRTSTIHGRNYQTVEGGDEKLLEAKQHMNRLRLQVKAINDWALAGAIKAHEAECAE